MLENGAHQLIHSKSPTLKNSHCVNCTRKNYLNQLKYLENPIKIFKKFQLIGKCRETWSPWTTFDCPIEDIRRLSSEISPQWNAIDFPRPVVAGRSWSAVAAETGTIDYAWRQKWGKLLRWRHWKRWEWIDITFRSDENFIIGLVLQPFWFCCCRCRRRRRRRWRRFTGCSILDNVLQIQWGYWNCWWSRRDVWLWPTWFSLNHLCEIAFFRLFFGASIHFVHDG